MLRRLLGSVGVVGALTIVGGCSGNTELTGPEYRAKVQDECRQARAAVGALPEPKAGATAAQVRVGREALEIQRDALGEIQSRDAPAVLEGDVAEWLDLTGQALDAAERSLAAQAAQDLAKANAANRDGGAAVARADALARQLRIPACAGSPVGP